MRNSYGEVKVDSLRSSWDSQRVKKTLLIRMDKIGDLVVSLNAEAHPGLAGGRCHWWIANGLDWVIEHSVPRKNFSVFSKSFSWSNLCLMTRELKRQRYDQAVVFQAPWYVSFALWLARVPIRCGRQSQWHSFIFFNRGLRQKRSLSKKHESQYNWDLITQATDTAWSEQDFCYPKLMTGCESAVFRIKNSEGNCVSEGNYIVVHPGMMGSALNWPTESYIELVNRLSQTASVVITGTEADRPYTQPVYRALSGTASILWMQEKLTPKELLTVLARAKAVVAPSTGIIHLAAALGTPVVGFYSPRTAESKVRWGPLTTRATIFSPLREMSEIQVDQVMDEAFHEVKQT